jgi:hypothetical protein
LETFKELQDAYKTIIDLQRNLQKTKTAEETKTLSMLKEMKDDIKEIKGKGKIDEFGIVFLKLSAFFKCQFQY